jgi:hypothetical protein
VRARWLCMLVAGCSFRHGQLEADTPIGSRPDAAPCFGSALIQVCETAMPAAQLDTSQPLDTDADCDANVMVNATNVCVKIAHQIDITSDWSAHGTRPLVLVAEDTITIEMRLDTSSHNTGAIVGPGANSTMCGTNSTPGATQGGPGGSFGGTGGPGSGTVTAAAPQARPMSLRGGCRGSDGAPYNAANGGIGGDSGGAIYLIAGTSITVASTGSIDSSGAGGHAGQAGGGGGGGGGSGGMIVLDTPLVMNLGNIFASGGGGAEGGDNVAGKNGGEAADATNAAPGGSGATTSGGGGGIGSFGTTTGGGPGVAGNVGSGDGGGGGAAGFILLFGGGSISGPGGVAPPPS